MLALVVIGLCALTLFWLITSPTDPTNYDDEEDDL